MDIEMAYTMFTVVTHLLHRTQHMSGQILNICTFWALVLSHTNPTHQIRPHTTIIYGDWNKKVHVIPSKSF